MFPSLVGPRGVLEQAVDFTYQGDNSNNREVDLGVVCDRVDVLLEESSGTVNDHLAYAYAFRECYGVFTNHGGANATRHSSMALANGYFQGLLAGADRTKIKLGASGAAAPGTNTNGRTYRVIGYRFREME